MIFFISADTIKIKINEKSVSLRVTYIDNFWNYFLDVDLSPLHILVKEMGMSL